VAALARRLAPGGFDRRPRTRLRRHEPEIPRDRVGSVRTFDLALALERRLGPRRPRARRAVARGRTRHFDRILARTLARRRPEAALIFSDVGSEFALPACRDLGIASVLS